MSHQSSRTAATCQGCQAERCDGCTVYEEELRRERERLAVALVFVSKLLAELNGFEEDPEKMSGVDTLEKACVVANAVEETSPELFKEVSNA